MKIRLLTLSALIFGIGNTVVLYLTFLQAVVNGGQVLVTINEYNEMLIEFIMIPIILIIMILGTIKYIKGE